MGNPAVPYIYHSNLTKLSCCATIGEAVPGCQRPHILKQRRRKRRGGGGTGATAAAFASRPKLSPDLRLFPCSFLGCQKVFPLPPFSPSPLWKGKGERLPDNHWRPPRIEEGKKEEKGKDCVLSFCPHPRVSDIFYV